MTYSATELRQNIYRILDEVLESGTPVEVKRHGKLLRIAPVEDNLWSRLERRDTIRCDPDELVHLDWSEAWKP